MSFEPAFWIHVSLLLEAGRSGQAQEGETWSHFCRVPCLSLGQAWTMGERGNELTDHWKVREAGTK